MLPRGRFWVGIQTPNWTRHRFFCFKFSFIPSNIPLTRETDKKCYVKLQFSNDTIYRHTKKHLALGNLAKLVFVSILSFKNWSFSKLLSFFCVSLSGERKIWRNKRKFRIKNWNLDTDNGWGNGRPPGASMKSPSKSSTLAKRDLEFRSPFSNSRICQR